MGALGIERSAGIEFRFYSSELLRCDAIIESPGLGPGANLNVQRRREATSSEIPDSAGDPLRDSAADAGFRVDPASHFRCTAFLPIRRVAAISARYEPRLRAGLCARQG